jgi:hypothetical protein
VAAILLVGAVLGACSSPNQTSNPSDVPAASVPPGASPTSGPPATFGPPPSPSPDDSSPVVIDEALLAYLPASIDNIPVTEDIDEAAEVLRDPALPRIATAAEAAVAVDIGSGNLVYGWIVRLKPDVFTDNDFRQWRDSYNEGACNAAGGVTGNAEATIAERNVFITNCAEGMLIYHLWLKDEHLLISASAIGAGRFGEKLLGNLRIPTASASPT